MILDFVFEIFGHGWSHCAYGIFHSTKSFLDISVGS